MMKTKIDWTWIRITEKSSGESMDLNTTLPPESVLRYMDWYFRKNESNYEVETKGGFCSGVINSLYTENGEVWFCDGSGDEPLSCGKYTEPHPTARWKSCMKD